MRTIYKYPLRESHSTVWMPEGAQVLCVQMQCGLPTLWALVDAAEAVQVARSFRIYGTGHNVEVAGRYVGTVQAGPFVWHVLEQDPA